MIFRFFFLLVLIGAAKAEIPLAERRSGYEFMGRETRAMQDDDATSQAVLWLLEGESLWGRKAGGEAGKSDKSGKSCADCHGDAGNSMKGVAARYPAFDLSKDKLINLDQRINLCRSEQQKAPAFPLEGREVLALSAYVGRQSRGLPIEILV